MVAELSVWQQFSPEEKDDRYLQLMVALRLIRKRPYWRVVREGFSLRRRVIKDYEYRITRSGELLLQALNWLTVHKVLPA